MKKKVKKQDLNVTNGVKKEHQWWFNLVFKNKNKIPKPKIHRHKWQQSISDCPFCGGGEYVECDCGEMKRMVYTNDGKHKLEKF